MSKKVTPIIKKIITLLDQIDDEAVLSAMLIFANSAKTPAKLAVLEKAVTAKPPKPTQALKTTVLEYDFRGKAMIAIQNAEKPDEATIAQYKALGLHYYGHVPANPFGNAAPFWAKPTDEATKSALKLVA